MKNNSSNKCDTPGCLNKVQAACFKCYKLFCFQCSMQHAQQNVGKNHNILEMEQSIKTVQKTSSELLAKIRELRTQGEKDSNADTEEYNNKLHPQKFQQQLDEISFMKKQTLKVVEKFYSEISLELVNMWEVFLKKYSSLDETVERLSDLQKKIKPFTSQQNFRDAGYDEILREYFREEFEKEVRFCKQKFVNRSVEMKNIPQCPSIRIDDRVLVQLSQVLCSAISTQNYTKIPESKKSINIDIPNYFNQNVKEIPIFPIKKAHCYLFDLTTKSYEIQEFNNLDYLPDYPKTILIPNGDIHIVGGIKKKQIILNTHLVFRSSSSEVFKLADLPYAINPANSLVYHNKHIYLIGGMVDKGDWTKKCIKYSLQVKEWKQISSLLNPKSHQSTVVFSEYIYCFGIPQNKKINIERYDINKNEWEQISIKNFLSNPFNFASGFTTVQINQNQILFLGGKKFLENVMNNKRSTDRQLSPNMYLFRPENNSFVQLGKLYPCLGVQYGEFNPIAYNGSIYFCQYLLSKNNPIARWYDNLQILQLNQEGSLQSIAVLNEE